MREAPFLFFFLFHKQTTRQGWLCSSFSTSVTSHTLILKGETYGKWAYLKIIDVNLPPFFKKKAVAPPQRQAPPSHHGLVRGVVVLLPSPRRTKNTKRSKLSPIPTFPASLVDPTPNQPSLRFLLRQLPASCSGTHFVLSSFSSSSSSSGSWLLGGFCLLGCCCCCWFLAGVLGAWAWRFSPLTSTTGSLSHSRDWPPAGPGLATGSGRRRGASTTSLRWLIMTASSAAGVWPAGVKTDRRSPSPMATRPSK